MTRPSKDYTETDLRLPAGLSYREFEEKCSATGTMARANRWWVGALVVKGEQRFGQKVYQAEIITVARRADWLARCAKRELERDS